MPGGGGCIRVFLGLHHIRRGCGNYPKTPCGGSCQLLKVTKSFRQKSSLFREEAKFFSQSSHRLHRSLKQRLDEVSRRFQCTVQELPALAFIIITNSHVGIKKCPLPPCCTWKRRWEGSPAKAGVKGLPRSQGT